MASTITLQDVALWATTFTKLIPIIGVGGYENEPALSICNNVIQRMLSRPYNWKFNSKVAQPLLTSTTSNLQDYQQNITDLGWLESAIRIDPASTQQPQPITLVETVRILQPSSDVSNPSKMASMFETDAGVTFRLWPVPNQSKQWEIIATYQMKAPLKDGLQNTWFPIPDELAFVYRQGFLAEAYKHADDPRFEREDAKFSAMMQEALGIKDMEANSEGFIPDFGLFLG
jgi:hypothetical protein